jgi:enterochelin esterase-like enzyme
VVHLNRDRWTLPDWTPQPRPQGNPSPLPVVRRAPSRDLEGLSESELEDLARGGPQVLDVVAEHPGWRWVRFMHRAPTATAVALCASGWWHPEPMDGLDLCRLRGTGWWVLEVASPRQWCVGYRFTEYAGDGAPPWWDTGLKNAHSTLELVADRANPLHLVVKQGAAVSRLHVPSRSALPEDVPAPAEALFSHPWAWPSAHVGQVPTVSGEPRTWWWAPEDAAEEPEGLAVLVFFDGEEHVLRHETQRFLAAAIDEGLLPPVLAVFVESGERRAEVLGVPGGRAAWVTGTLVPRLAEHGLRRPDGGRIRISRDPRRRIVTGASFGGLSTLFAVAADPGTVGAGIVQSPSLWRFPGQRFDLVLRDAQRRRGRLRLSMAAGSFEGDMLPMARRLHSDCAAQGLDVGPEVRAMAGGHDWAWWIPDAVHEAARMLG